MLAVKFGSEAQGKADKFSDKDILLMSRNWSDVSTYKKELEEVGYSISYFSFERAEYAIKNGSLFFRHVFDEGKLLIGEQGEWASLGRKWSHSTFYIDEVESNYDLLEILRYIPQTQAGIATAVDIVIASVRNILIRRLARESVYKFAWEDIFLEAVQRKWIVDYEREIFFRARKYKSAYRLGRHIDIPLSFFESLLDAASSACNFKCNWEFDYNNQLVKLPEKCNEASYKQLRAIELVCSINLRDSTLKELKKIVKHPNYFISKKCNIKK